MLHNRYFVLILKILLCTATALFAVLIIKKVLPCFLPFLLAFFTASAFEPLISGLCRKFRFKRQFASISVLTIFFLAIIVLLILFAAKLLEEIYGFFHDLPNMLSGLREIVEYVNGKVDGFILSMPDGSREYIESILNSISAKISEQPGVLSARALTVLSQFATLTPNIFLFAGTYITGTFFISLGYREIKAFIKRQFSHSQQVKIAEMKADFIFTILRWLKAQMILMLITFGELTIALTVLDVKYSILSALIISLIDALPVFGIGTVIFPWAIYCLISGSASLGLGLVISYIVISFIRSCLEPKLVGGQIGLHPVVTLAAIYLGFKVFGFFGIIFAPIVLIMIKQMNDKNYIKLWK